MRIVVALGGNALLRRGQPMTAQAQRENVRIAAEALAPLARSHELVISHGNGPQVGLLALQGAAYKEVDAYPLDVLGAETEGMIGYMIEQELLNILGSDVRIATLLTMIEVDPADEAFRHPTKFIGPVYPKDRAERLAAEKGWVVRQDGDAWRRVVPSPRPGRIVELAALDLLVSGGVLVICAGGGGIPVARDETGRHVGVEAVIDKDFASELLARRLKADLFIMATDVPGVFVDWGRPDERLIRQASPDHLEALALPAGSMGPKVEAACHFVRTTGGEAAIGALGTLPEIVAGRSGTRIAGSASQIRYGDRA